jgi:hypothetical protein
MIDFPMELRQDAPRMDCLGAFAPALTVLQIPAILGTTAGTVQVVFDPAMGAYTRTIVDPNIPSRRQGAALELIDAYRKLETRRRGTARPASPRRGDGPTDPAAESRIHPAQQPDCGCTQVANPGYPVWLSVTPGWLVSAGYS